MNDLHEQARRICHQLLCGRTELTALPELTADPELADEVSRRLDAVGLTVQQARGYGRWVVTGDPGLRAHAEGHDLSEPLLAALAYLLFHLQIAPAPQAHDHSRMLVHDFTAQFGKPRDWTAEYVRRAVLGPLERLEYINVVVPGGSRREAYITAGPRMSLLDRGKLVRALGRHADTEAA